MSERYDFDQTPPWIERLPDGRPDYPMTRNLKIQPQCMGLEIPAMPFADKTSAQRTNMWTTSSPQAVVINGAEYPQVASGFEREYLKYTFNATRVDQRAMILACIPRYGINSGADPIKKCPEYLVIYFGEEDKQVHSMWVSTYHKGTNGFGWTNHIDRSKMVPGSVLEKDETISHSNAVQGSKYCKGINVNVCYGTWPGTVEDAIIVSDDMVERGIATGYSEILVDIPKDYVPLNVHGDEDVYKFLPDIGECIGEGGVLCALREVDKLTYFSDMTSEALRTLQPLHDKIIYHTGRNATVADIEVYRNPNRRILTPANIFAQLDKYESGRVEFNEQILKIYEKECVEKGRTPAHTFRTVVRAAGQQLTTIKKRVMGATRKTTAKFRYKDMPISHILAIVTIKYDIKPSLGTKLCSYWGDKGVVSAIVPKENMPVNDMGIRADFIQTPMGIPNRMNPGQWYNLFISELCRVVLEDMREQTDWHAAYKLMLDLFYDINCEYAKVIDEYVFTTEADKKAFTKEALAQDYLIVVVPPSLDNIDADWVYAMRDKYNIRQTPVTFNQLDSDGKVMRRNIRTKRPIFIGKKYVFVLCKVPFCKASGLGYINDLGVPITVKDAGIKAQNQVSPTPIRSGEDETRNFQNNLGPVFASRLLGVNANSPEAAQQLAQTILNASKPSAVTFIPSTGEDIAKSSRVIMALREMMNICGIDIGDIIASEDEIKNFFARG